MLVLDFSEVTRTTRDDQDLGVSGGKMKLIFQHSQLLTSYCSSSIAKHWLDLDKTTMNSLS